MTASDTSGEAPRDNAYFLTPAPGHYGDRAHVLSSHTTLSAALAARRRHQKGSAVVRSGCKRRGDVWLSSYETLYPIVT